MAWEENSCICLNMQLIAILSRIGVIIVKVFLVTHGGGLAARPRFYLCCRSAVSRYNWGVSRESVGSSCGPASQEALSRHLSTPGVHPCWGKSSLYLYAFRTNQTRKRVLFNKVYDFFRFWSPCCKFHPERAAPDFWVAKWWQKWWQTTKNDDSFS